MYSTKTRARPNPRGRAPHANGPLFSGTASPRRGPLPRPLPPTLPEGPLARSAGGFLECCPYRPGPSSPAACPASVFLHRTSLCWEGALSNCPTAKNPLPSPAPMDSPSNTLVKWELAPNTRGSPDLLYLETNGSLLCTQPPARSNLCVGPPSNARFRFRKEEPKGKQNLSRVPVRCRGAGMWIKPGGFCHLQLWPPLLLPRPPPFLHL